MYDMLEPTEVGVRVTRSARKHRVGNQYILEALQNGNVVGTEGDFRLFIGVDSRGVELEVGVVPDNREPNQLAVIHATPTTYRRRET